MTPLIALQAEVTRARAKLAAAFDTYYRAMQDKPAGAHAAARKAHAEAQAELDKAIAAVAALGTPDSLLAEIPGDIPQLLLPVRVEARYLTSRHVARVRSLDDVVDISTSSIAGSVAGVGIAGTSYEVPNLESLPRTAHTEARAAALQIRSGKWFVRRADRDELWVRIYPDTLLTNAFEPDLQEREVNAGRAFWTAVFAGEDAFTAWQRLVDATDVPRAAWIVRALRPRNAGDTSSGTPVFPDVRLKDGAYTRAPVARLLPERFIARLTKGDVTREFVGGMVPEPLPLGLDPLDANEDSAETSIVRDGAILTVPASVRWLHDLDAAEQVGMAIRVDLAQHPEFRDGVDSLIVLGVKLSTAPDEAQRMLSEHLENCVHKESGLAILAQGTPTNATGDLTKRAAADAESRQWFDAVWTPDRDAASDGARVRHALGIADAVPVPGDHLRDIDEAELANTALWPATLGYLFLQFMSPKMDEASRERVRAFFVKHVTGRGRLPVLRIDRQPYGILPTTSFDHWTQGPGGEAEMFRFQLWTYIKTLDVQWKALLPQVDAQIATASTSDRLDTPFLAMLGLTASSSRLERDVLLSPALRYALMHMTPAAGAAWAAAGFDSNARMLELARMRLSNTSYTTLAESFFSVADRRRVRTPFVAAESETYLSWLAGATFDKVWRAETKPETVLAHLARHSLLRTYVEAGMRVAEPDPVLWLLRVMDHPLERLHDGPITINPQQLDNVFLEAYQPIVEKFARTTPFTLDPDHKRALASVEDKLDRPGDAVLAPIAERKQQLARLAQLPPARLERLLGEHLDVCSHRLDAWLLGIVGERLERQRAAQPTKLGVGAFGYLFGITRSDAPAVRYVEVTPETIAATGETFANAVIPVAHVAHARTLGIDEKQMFVYLGEATASGALLDGGTFRAAPGTNARHGHGYLHAPSQDHAAAAAVLYAAHASYGTSDPMLAIDLESNRARDALGVLDKLQEGASLGELLGVQLERAMHELQLDAKILDIREAFPLRPRDENSAARSLATTDGLAVLEAARKPQPPPLVAAIAPAVAKIANTLDAVSDLLLAESVYQSTKGKSDRAAAALRTLHAGGQVVAPEIVRSPTSGRSVHHRVAIVFERGEAPAASPRGALAPDCNRWLAGQLPDPATVVIAVTLPDGSPAKLTLADLDLQPLDLLAAAPESRATAGASALAALVAIQARAARFGGEAGTIAVDLTSRRGLTDNELSVGELAPQLAAAKRLLAASRPLAISDLVEPGSTSAPRVDSTRLAAVLQKLSSATGALAKLATELRAAVAAPKLGNLEASLSRAWLHGVDAAPLGAQDLDAVVRRALAAADELDRRRFAGAAALETAPADDSMARYEALASAATALLGPGVRTFPEVAVEVDGPFARAYGARERITGVENVEPWLHETSLARDQLRTYRRLVLLREAFATAHAAISPTVVQLPATSTPHPWIGGAFDTGRDPGTVSLVLELPEGFIAKGAATGILVDEWPELVPARVASTGVAFHVEQPDSEPPQVILFAVSPDERGNWTWEHLVGAVLESIRLAKRRLVTPALIEAYGGALATILPGLTMPVAPGSSQVPTVELT